jgi:hypothetical protein
MHTARRIVGPDSLQQDSPDIVIVMNAITSARFMINETGNGCEVVNA